MQNELALRTAVEKAMDAFFLLTCQRDESGQIVDFTIKDVNQAAEEQLGMAREALIGHGICELFPVNRADAHFERYRHVFETQQPLEDEFTVPSDYTAPGYYQRHVIPLPDGIVIFTRDISERKQAEALLRQQQSLLTSLNDNIREGLYRFDVRGKIVYANKALLNLFGYSTLEEMSTVPPSALFANPAEQAVYVEKVAATGVYSDNELLLRRRDGTTFWAHDSGRVIHDDAGNPLYFDGVVVDITERKRTEEALLEKEKQLYALQKEREINALRNKWMTTITHEFRTPLAIILSSSELLDRYFERLTDEKRHKQLQKIREQVRALSEMLKDISLVSEGGYRHLVLQETSFDLEQLIRATISEMEATRGQNHQFILNTDDIRYRVIGDRLLIRRMLLNLLSNAIKFSKPGTTISLELLTSYNDVIVRISDEGIGIEAADMERIFEPFHRGNNVSATGGAGLGLAIVKECVTLHKGSIQVQSEVNKGTTFTVRLPIIENNLTRTPRMSHHL